MKKKTPDADDGRGDSRPLLSISQAAAQLGLAAITVQLWASERKIDSTKIGRRVLILPGEVDRLISQNFRPRAE
jgi:excisionase family DNA binding protein